ncbi:Acyl transferase/acyl hydrolase/lysophospholipase [Penicillium maclennaniae]|uniref:Acyl transferase/acyl hydrolase/lysophospholipase n=1 Tax=Penicillium maclennaniae TaxID=1343394 RepID=UPI00253FA5E4|nr:Acyl transferase/acyl hydrolase/lysophospholipase [Penicillium maclennaniae]KAJ5675273.1 Acyl transferase/acyl hydrolase/lysophospholipase [Penicillium maclennaniae]
MAQLNYERVHEEPLKPCDVFDLIGGTSTGGLIAIMLGRLEMGIEECISAYSELMHLIFGQKLNNLPVDWAGNIRAQYDSTKLKHAIGHVIERAGAAPNELMNNGQARRCRAFVCTTSKDTLQIARLRSYDVTNEGTIPATICEAALATSAATGFFEAVSIGDLKFVDGAFGANNPMEEVEEEAADIWCTTSRVLRPLVKCFLSIGTGAPAKAPIDDNMLKFLSKTLVRMATKPESTEQRFMARWSKELREKHVCHFNVEQGLQDVHMTDYQKRSVIESATYDYLHHASQKGRVRDCVLNLLSKKGKTDLDFDIVMRAYEAQELRSQVIQTIQCSETPSVPGRVPCWIVPFERNHRFVDRELLGGIKRKLFLGRQMQRIAIVGLGGVGKTQISLELAFQVRATYPDCSIFWIPVVDMESVQQAYQSIASQLGIEPSNADGTDVKKAVQQHLSRPQSGRWLLVYDNADDLSMWTHLSSETGGEGLREYLPKATDGQGAIVFTTRSNRVAQYLASTEVVEIAEMDERKATKVLKNLLVNKSLVMTKKTPESFWPA